ncbi:acetate--CoA ligase family protein [Aeromicrobium sp. CF4.19]|uniref:acetate--CoA ligase family protein n=1 Tax=Aeromicrobium sp. CF4.19 TaxID=3373082 RepID=UPI003EE57F52
MGASDDLAKVGARPLKYLRDAGWQGRIYPVNPRRDTVLGERAWASLAALPEVPEHAFILTDSSLALDAVRECADLGVTVATVMASGFAESGPEGVARHRELADIVAHSSLRVVGPSSLGVVNPRCNLVLTANAAFAETGLPVGSTFVASHSGSVIGALVSRGKAMGVGFAGLISTGGEVDLTLGEICAATLDDPGVASYALFIESLAGLGDLRAFSVAAAQRGKPIVAYKLGRSRAAADLAVSHTGALAGDDAVAATVLADLGIARVHTFEALLEGQQLARLVPLPDDSQRPSTVGVITTTGGGGAMVVDQLAVAGVDVVGASDETRARLAERGIDAGSGALIDLTLAGTKYEVMKAALEVILTAPEFDLVVAVAGSSARNHPELAVRPIADSVSIGTPLAAFVVPHAPDALELLHRSGVPAFRTPESCADAVAAVFARRRPRATAVVTERREWTGQRVLDEEQSAVLLRRHHVPISPNKVLSIDDEITSAPFDGPMVVKALTADLPHKSDAGGVVIGVVGTERLREATSQIVTAVAERAQIRVANVLVQPMVKPLGEVLVGYRLDPEAGPLVMLASGGVTAELHDDRSLRPAPVSKSSAEEMIAEVVGLKVLAGYRGAPKGDLDALADTVVAISKLAANDDLVLEAEVNPLMVYPEGEGVLGVDCLAVLATSEEDEPSTKDVHAED